MCLQVPPAADMIKQIIFYCCMVAPWAVAAQDNYFLEAPKKFEGGLVAGANFTQVDGDTYYGYNKVGLDAGAMVYVHFTEKVGATMELLYAQKGSRGEDIIESQYIGTYVQKYFMNLNYVEVPITFHYIEKGFDVEAGLSFGVLVKSSEWVFSDVPVIIDPVANRFNTFDWEYVFGISRKLYKHYYANARYQYSIVDMRPTSRVPLGFSYSNAGQFNNLFELRILYLF